MTWATFVPTGEAETPKKPAVGGKKPPDKPDKK
jgi:hypothetical protein